TEQLQATFEGPVRVRYNLHPPFLRLLGRQRKVELGSWFRGVFWVLRSLRGLRGTRFDIFGYQASRREERALILWYREVLDRVLLRGLTPRDLPLVLELLSLPGWIRGYEALKSRNAERARDEAGRLLDRLERDEMTSPLLLPPAGQADDPSRVAS